MRDNMVEEAPFDTAGEGIEVALPGDTIRLRHIATRASNRRRIIVFVVGDAEFEGYSIGLDSHSLQLLELPSGDVSSISLDHIVAITDGLPFNKLSPDEKDTVDRRTASFRKTSQAWLVANWPKVYDRRDDEEGHLPTRQRFNRQPYVKYGGRPADSRPSPEGLNSDADSQVRD